MPEDVLEDEKAAALQSLTVPLALERVRAVCAGPLLVLKGAELGARYPAPSLRPATDVDLLVPDPDDVQRRLLEGGFAAIGEDDAYYRPTHHLRPLVEPNLGVKLEVHRRPEWVKWTSPPPPEDLFRVAVPSAVDVDGVSSLPPAYHALVVAAHSWCNLPFRRLLDLVDLEVLLTDADREEVVFLAERWDLAGVMGTMISAADSIFFGAPPSWPLRTWASDMAAAREPTVFRTHVHRLLGPFWALPPHRAAVVAGRVLARELLPAPGESWGRKLTRSRLALRNAFRRRSEHESRLPHR